MFFTLTKWWLDNRILTIIFLTVSFYTISSSAQVIQPGRSEILMGDTEQTYEVIPAGDKGLFLYRGLATVDSDVIEISFLDTALQQKWHGYIAIERGNVIVGHRFYDSALFLILHYKDFTKNDLKIISINFEKGQFITYDIKNFIPFVPSEFHITQEAAIIGGYFNKTPVALYYHFVSKKSKIVPGLFNEPGELTQIKTYPDGTFDILVSAKNIDRKKAIWVRSYDGGGGLVKNIMLESESKRNLIFGRAIKAPGNMQIVAGVYSTTANDYTRGIFIASISADGAQDIRYYNYADLQNFFKYMKARREARVKSRIERRRVKGRKNRFNYKMLIHELVPYQDHFVLLGEAFYPQYTSRNNYGGSFFNSYSYSPYRSPAYSSNGLVFDGYYYTHAVVLGVDVNGKLLWDNSFEINDVKTFKLEQFVKIDVKENKIALLYLFDNEFRSKIIQDSNVLEGKSSEPIKLKSEQDFSKKNITETSKLEYWYNDHFIAYGIQRINNSVSGPRKVFFINKVQYK